MKRIVFLLVLLAAILGFLGVNPVEAHTPKFTVTCDGLTIDLTNYQSSGDSFSNIAEVTLDGIQSGAYPFDKELHHFVDWPTKSNTHTWSVFVDAYRTDDPKFEGPFGETFTGDCVETTTTTSAPETTTTMPATTTTVPETTTTVKATTTVPVTIPETTTTVKATTTVPVTIPETTQETTTSVAVDIPPVPVVVIAETTTTAPFVPADSPTALPNTGTEYTVLLLLAGLAIGVGATLFYISRPGHK